MNAPSLARLIPAFSWLRTYDQSWMRSDVFAGITLAAYLLPAGLGDASLANLPPEAGLYACLFGGLVFWLFCSSRHTVVTVTSAISLLTVASLAVIILRKIFLKNKPVSLFVVIRGIVAASALSLGARGVKLLGNVPQGLPPLGLPAVYWHDLNELLPLAFACFLLGAVETAAIGRMFTAKHGGRFDANQEFLALAASNLGAGLGRGFPISGGMSQSLVNEGGGARTPLSGALAAGIILVVVL